MKGLLAKWMKKINRESNGEIHIIDQSGKKPCRYWELEDTPREDDLRG